MNLNLNYSNALADFIKTILESQDNSSVNIHIDKDDSKINFNVIIEETKEHVTKAEEVKEEVKEDVKEDVKEEVIPWDKIKKEVEEFEKGCNEPIKKINILPYDPTENVHCEIINGKHEYDDTASKLFDNYSKSNDNYVSLRSFPKRELSDIS